MGVKGDKPGERSNWLRVVVEGPGLGMLPSEPLRFLSAGMAESSPLVSTERRSPNRNGRLDGTEGPFLRLPRGLPLVSPPGPVGATRLVGLFGPDDSVEACVTNCGLDVDVGLLGGLASAWDRDGIGSIWSLDFSNLLTRSLKETCRDRLGAAALEFAFVVSDADRFCCSTCVRADELTALYDGSEATR